MREIKLSKGLVAIVDDEDYETLSQWSWSACRAGSRVTWYARRSLYGVQLTSISMHRQIMGAPEGMQVDHIDGNGLNNRRSNLRVCTMAQNLKNKKTPKKRSLWASKYKGVYPFNPRDPSQPGWRVQIMSDGEIYTRREVFDTQESAARAYDRLAVQHHGEFARLNFPDERPEPFPPDPVETGPKYACGDCGLSFWACDCADIPRAMSTPLPHDPPMSVRLMPWRGKE